MELNVEPRRPCVFEYDDYRVLLKDLFDFYKNTTSFFSYRYFARRAGFASPNFLKLVIEAQRNLSPDSASRCAVAMKLDKAETDFFKNLVQFCQAKSSSERAVSAREIVKSRAFKRFHPLKQAEMNYYAKWYYIPVREMVGTTGFRNDPTWIASRFVQPLEPEQVAEALRDLEQLGLIERTEEGLSLSHRNVCSGDDVVSSLISQYHRDMINRGRESIDTVRPAAREVSGTCISCSAETVDQIKKLIREFRKEILAVAEESKEPDRVYQLNFQLFPLAQIGDGHE
jgi:uncharacterized protein (TIGR02147 family)